MGRTEGSFINDSLPEEKAAQLRAAWEKDGVDA